MSKDILKISNIKGKTKIETNSINCFVDLCYIRQVKANNRNYTLIFLIENNDLINEDIIVKDYYVDNYNKTHYREYSVSVSQLLWYFRMSNYINIKDARDIVLDMLNNINKLKENNE